MEKCNNSNPALVVNGTSNGYSQANGSSVSTDPTVMKNDVNKDHSQANASAVITEKMLLEERRLEEKSVFEEQEERKKLLEEEKILEEERCYKRLNLLLSRSSIYAKFMAEKLQKHDDKMKKKDEREKLKILNQDNESANRKKRGTKRKANETSPRKKCKSDATIMDVFKKQNMENVNLNRDDKGTLNAESKLPVSVRQPNLLYGGTMRDYQLDGFDWLKTLFENGVNGILADEMGLGKTIQCIAFIAYLIEMGVPGPFFVCGPLSTVPNWCDEFKRFTPDIPVVLYHGTKEERAMLRQKILQKVKVKDFYCCPVVITSYQIALNDAPKLARVGWKMLVIDEAHRIKNFQCKLISALKTYNAIHRLLLTGTPLQNNLAELWSLLNFILPEIFDDLQVFRSWFDIARLTQNGITQEIMAQEQEKQIVSTIHQILTPFLLRRTKSDVELSLPPKKMVMIHAPLTQLQHKYYTGVLNDTIRNLLCTDQQEKTAINIDEGRPKRKLLKTDFFGVEQDCDFYNLKSDPNTTIVEKKSHSQTEDPVISELHLKLTNIMMCLRKICCHPYLISYPMDSNGYVIDENIVKSSGKLLVLDVLLPELQRRGHKVLLFSQFVTMLEILEDYCTFRNYKFTCLYGSMNLEERQEHIKAFSEDDSIFLFLISTKAGGLGINVTAADTVIFYDNDWNPQGDLQAQDRCHRIGQTKPVVVYRLLIPNTVDEKVLNYATAKRKLEKVIIQKGRFNSKHGLNQMPKAITKEELLELLESSDVHNCVNADNFVIPPEELDRILDRSGLKNNKCLVE